MSLPLRRAASDPAMQSLHQPPRQHGSFRWSGSHCHYEIEQQLRDQRDQLDQQATALLETAPRLAR
mgnify:CR=1 FL=1